ncbi:MAG: HAD-IA family hydrolase [Verrucomicrobiales bacterium]
MRALLFDFDGLILDTETPVYESWREVYEAHGEELPISQYAECVGSTHARFDPATELEHRLGRALNWAAITPERRARSLALVHQQSTLPGVADLLAEARAEGIPCAVASSSPPDWVRPLLDRLGLSGFFRAVCCLGEAAHRAKPEPDLFLAAAAQLNIDPRDALVLEDSHNGLRAAQAAGAPCVIVPNSITQHYAFHGAAAVLKSMPARAELAAIWGRL